MNICTYLIQPKENGLEIGVEKSENDNKNFTKNGKEAIFK